MNIIFNNDSKSPYFYPTGARTPYVAPQQDISTDGLLIYLDAENPLSYPGTGDIWYDLSPYENDATKVGTISWNDTDKYFSIAAYDRYFTTETGTEWIFNETWTYAIWFYPTNNQAYVMGKLPANNLDIIYNFGSPMPTYNIETWNNLPPNRLDGCFQAVPYNNWYNVIFTKGSNTDTNNYKGYLNGDNGITITRNYTITLNNNGIHIGINLIGRVKRVIVYNRMITDAEASFMWNKWGSGA